MNHEPTDEVQGALDQRVARVLAGTAQFTAPRNIEARVLDAIEHGARAPWWKRRVLEWPLLAQLLFAATGIMAAAALLLGRPARLNMVMHHQIAVLQQPAAGLHATLDVLAVFHRLADTIAGSLPDGVWYGGIGLCAIAYVALFYLIVFGYRALRSPPVAR